MTVVCDTSLVLGLFLPDDSFHARAVAFYDALDEDLVTTPLAVAEMDYLLEQRGGRSTRDLLWDGLESGALQVRWWASAMAETLTIARRAPKLGLSDASLVALAPILRTTRIATFDQRHFRSIRTPDGEPYMLLP